MRLFESYRKKLFIMNIRKVYQVAKKNTCGTVTMLKKGYILLKKIKN